MVEIFLSEEDKLMKPGKRIEMFDAYCNPRKSTTVQHKMFYERNLGERETLDEWITQLRLLCSLYGADDMTEDRIVLGTNLFILFIRIVRQYTIC